METSHRANPETPEESEAGDGAYPKRGEVGYYDIPKLVFVVECCLHVGAAEQQPCADQPLSRTCQQLPKWRAVPGSGRQCKAVPHSNAQPRAKPVTGNAVKEQGSQGKG